MATQFDHTLMQIDEALRSGDVHRAGPLFFQATEAASRQGMIINERGDALTLRSRSGASGQQPSRIVESGILVGLLIEDTGYKAHAPGLISNAKRYLELLMKYASQALSTEEIYGLLKPQLMLSIQSGAYCGALILAQSALLASKYGDPLEMITMQFNLGSIYVHLERFDEARHAYRAALDLAESYRAPTQLVSAIRKSLLSCGPGYDPDFMFLPDSATPPKDPPSASKSTLSQAGHMAPDSAQMVVAARENKFDTVRKLLEQGCNVNARDEYGSTALIYAVAAHDEASIKHLLSRGADVNLADAEGRTALFYSILWQCPVSTAKMLIEHGADAGLEDCNGTTPLMLAMMFPSDEQYKTRIIELLRNA